MRNEKPQRSPEEQGRTTGSTSQSFLPLTRSQAIRTGVGGCYYALTLPDTCSKESGVAGFSEPTRDSEGGNPRLHEEAGEALEEHLDEDGTIQRQSRDPRPAVT